MGFGNDNVSNDVIIILIDEYSELYYGNGQTVFRSKSGNFSYLIAFLQYSIFSCKMVGIFYINGPRHTLNPWTLNLLNPYTEKTVRRKFFQLPSLANKLNIYMGKEKNCKIHFLQNYIRENLPTLRSAYSLTAKIQKMCTQRD